MMTRNLTLVVLAAATALTACAPRVEQPEIRLEEARLASLGVRGGVVDVRLSVHNPNRFAVEARGLTYDLEIRDPQREVWVPFTEGRIDRTLRVGARDGIEITLPVEFSYRGLGEAMRGMLDRGAFEYRLSGIVEIQAPVRRDVQYQPAGRYAPASED
jgi:LEA14-like dessication related protein